MTARMLDRALAPLLADDRPSSAPTRPAPDVGHDALSRLTLLRDRLAAANVAVLRDRWHEPPVFFFDRRRQSDFEAASSPPLVEEASTELSDQIARELPLLFRSVEVRRVARAITGFGAAVESFARTTPVARELAELLAVPDDEVVLVLLPERRAGYRLAIRGVADVGQLHVLMADALTGDPSGGLLPGPAMPARFVTAYRDVNPATPAGVPMIVPARWQLYSGAALEGDGTLPDGMQGCQHWLWPSASVAAILRMHGERTVLLGPPAYAASWEVTRRFPEMQADVRVIEVLSPFRVSERISLLTKGRRVPPSQVEAGATLSKAA